MIDENVDEKKESFENLPYHKFIGLKVTDYSEGYCELSVPVGKQLLNANGVVHGGIYYTVCDLAASAAIETLLGDDYFVVTSDINVSVLAAVHKGELIFRANILKLGKRLAFVESKVFDDSDNLIVIARVTKTILARKQ